MAFTLPPSVLMAVSQLLITLAFADRSPTTFRLIVVVCLLFQAWDFQNAAANAIESRIHLVFLTSFMWIQSLLAFDGLLLFKSYADDQTSSITRRYQDGQTKNIPGLRTKPRLFWGFHMAFNSRAIGTPWETEKIPGWPSDLLEKSSESQSPTRKSLILRLLRNAILSYLALDLIALQPPPLPSLIPPDKESLLHRLPLMTTEEFTTRLLMALGCWVNAYAVLIFISSTIYLLHIAIFRLPVEMYPPVWGTASSAWSVRQFWGVAWHQTLRRPLSSIASFIAHDILRLPRHGSLVARYLKLYIAFFISGIIHWQSDMMTGIPPEERNAIWFFTANATAIMLEDGVQCLTRRVLGEKSAPWRRYVGYVWVCVWFFYAVPPWLYPSIRYFRYGVDRLFPPALSVAWRVQGALGKV